MQSPFVHVLLAVGPDHLERLFKETLEYGNRHLGAQFEIVSTVAKERQFLEELIQLESPEIVVLHEQLPHTYNTNTEAGKEENEKDLLAMVERWRIFYPNMRVVYICERDRTDPFLGNLVARNVLDIFYERTISQETLVKQLMAPAHFKNVKQLQIGTVELEQGESEEEKADKPVEAPASKTESALIQRLKGAFSGQSTTPAKSEPVVTSEPKPEPIVEATIEKVEPTPEVEVIEPTLEKTEAPITELPPKPVEQKPKIPFIRNPFSRQKTEKVEKSKKEDKKGSKTLAFPGTVTISVSSLIMQGGSTQLAMALAHLLSKDKKPVAIIEANISGDFNRLHALHEGESPRMVEKIHQFQLDGIDNLTFYKWHSLLDIRSIQANYAYIIIDGGMYNHSRYASDIDGSHIRFLLTSSMEWKDYLIENFAAERLRQKRPVSAESFIFALPQTDHKRLSDIEKRFKNYRFTSVPSIPFPFELEEKSVKQLKSMLTSYL